ncbi:MAG: hypothetical protein ACI9TH_001363 [Kiritimatiellia bacterium]|jgi:hypothetical protein
MKVCFVFFLSVSLVSGVFAELNQPPEGFTALFNGKDLKGWWGLGTEDPAKWKALSDDKLKAKREASLKDIAQHWRVEDGILINDGHGLYLSTDKDYGDFEFMVDYKTVPKADSGIYLRGIPQVQIWDSTEEAKFKIGANKGSGGLWNNKNGQGKDPLVLADKPFGEWNSFRIRMVGERTSVWLNDKLVVDHAPLDNFFHKDEPLPRTGPIELQTHGGEISWRNVFIREIGGDEANQILAAKSNEGFKSQWDGKTFAGWKGPLENYEIVDGAIRCKAGKGGTIFTEDRFTDHVIRLEFTVPPGGNNGLAIRYPGQGNTAYIGMCELQVLDNEAEKYAKLDKRQYHGSAYGMIAAHRGYLREPGEWNFQEVTVKGSTLKVELNGTVILDGDLGAVTEYMANSKHPGLKNADGHFGFAGHSDPVSFRNISIKSL